MQKKLESELISLAHSILQMKDKDDVFALLKKAAEVHEKLSVLAFVEDYVNTTPNLEEDKIELLEKVEKGFELKGNKKEEVQEMEAIEEESLPMEIKENTEKVVYTLVEEEKSTTAEIPEDIDTIKEEPKLDTSEEIIEQPFDELEQILFEEPILESEVKEEVKAIPQQKTLTLDEELKDTVSVDITASLFDDAPKSLNEQLSKNIQIGLNDRIAFVKNLFENNQEDYNRVISQLNSFHSQKEAKKFITKNVKPDYDWSTQEELENRFMDFIERKFA